MSARKTRTVRVRVLKSFNGMVRGDEADLEFTPRVRGWLDAGLVKVVGDGKDPARPGSAQPDDNERQSAGVEGSVPSSGEQGQGFGTSAYGAS